MVCLVRSRVFVNQEAKTNIQLRKCGHVEIQSLYGLYSRSSYLLRSKLKTLANN